MDVPNNIDEEQLSLSINVYNNGRVDTFTVVVGVLFYRFLTDSSFFVTIILQSILIGRYGQKEIFFFEKLARRWSKVCPDKNSGRFNFKNRW